ncbi:putative protein (DUF4006 domain) [Campylobacter pinnipediorum subsp. caledonicus]|uniref:DUF4006 family protein n=1 Tax=Campylobacter pinnipediorum TaxID=1965231 RepID=UPI000995BCB7|nr:DUF4006 family protein [Campylobacter pinnipediorum]AQW85625.1 putative protein (DUF4006 domain) [Campylobacter pinnipediorum subsp. caledonicus]
MQNENRSIFALNGVTGMLIATVLLLSILGVLTYFAIIIQQDVSTKPYKIENASGLKAKSVENKKHFMVKE